MNRAYPSAAACCRTRAAGGGTPAPALDAEPLVSRAGLAYLVYNDVAWAEMARRVPTPLGEGGPATAHYGAVERVVVRNELFAVV